MSDDGPPLLRPIPRRPFGHSLTSPTPPNDDDSAPPSPNPEHHFSKLLTPQQIGQSTASESGSLSRAQSILNLTTSTLFGIYSPGTYGKDRFFGDRDDPDTPWGTGAQTPIKRPSLDEPTYELMKDRSRLPRRHSSYPQSPVTPAAPIAVTSLSLGLRASLLFLLGMGYGVLLARLQDGRNLTTFSVEGIIQPGYDWRYATMWGVSGVVLGALLPWFDGVWDNAFRNPSDRMDEQSRSPEKEPTDWALVVRSIGAFVGIVFAIRKLPWASTLQLSLTLALVNPFLWYLIDRSKPGFLLSVAVGITGSAVLLGINPEVMPAPSGSPLRNGSVEAYSDPLMLGGLASQETIETGIWMLSVLFCSCVCFGNIGRRLSLSTSTASRGRLHGAR